MFVIYLGLGIVVAIFIVYFGLQLSKEIHHPTLITFFWILYLASVLTIINVTQIQYADCECGEEEYLLTI
jgi:uncharacterized membrane protein